jgi:dihydrodipicolinate synthase/N-acetylneuraminate lyase
MAHDAVTREPDERVLGGVLPVFQTPYHEDESIDFGTLEHEIDWLYEHEVDGLVMGMVSELLRLGSEEREQLADHVCRSGSGRGVVIIGTGAESTHLAERYARHAESVGADAVMAIPPVATALAEDELRGYYERIVEAVAIPVIVQDASGYVGKPMSIELQAKLLKDLGDQIMFKPEAEPTGPRLSALRDATGGRARVFEGSGGIALADNYRRGIAGTMPGAEVIDGIVALWRALEIGDDDRIYRLSLPIASLVALQHGLDGLLAVEKYLLVKRGVFQNEIVRGPVGYALDQETRREVDRLFDILSEAVQETRVHRT